MPNSIVLKTVMLKFKLSWKGKEAPYIPTKMEKTMRKASGDKGRGDTTRAQKCRNIDREGLRVGALDLGISRTSV